jgi:uncharacterized lipoprotein YmbA
MKKVWLLASLAAAVLSGCGGGGSDPPPPVTQVIPSTVNTSVAEFIVYLKQLVVTPVAVADTLEPIDTTGVVPAKSDTTEPDSV